MMDKNATLELEYNKKQLNLKNTKRKEYVLEFSGKYPDYTSFFSINKSGF